jgi:hypothetical protein
MQPTRRDLTGYSALALASVRAGIGTEGCTEVNDVHSQLNLTYVAGIVRPRSLALRETFFKARREG